MEQGEIVIYKSFDNSEFQMEVRVENETIWLSQKQMSELFDCSIDNIALHLKNIFQEQELNEIATSEEYSVVQKEGGRKVRRKLLLYNLDAIISVGYRVNSIRGTQFRIWANKVLKEYLLKGHVVNHRLEKIENDVFYLKGKVNEFDFQIKTNLPPNEGIFYDGQIFDAYKFVSKLIKSAVKSIVLINNYIDESVLHLLSKRHYKVDIRIYTQKVEDSLKLDLKKYQMQYSKISIHLFKKSHDRFLIIDNKTVYHFGASLKDLGKKWFAFSKMNIDSKEIISRLAP